MNVRDLKKLLCDIDDDAEIVFVEPGEDDNDAATLEPLCAFDVEDDEDGNPVFALGIDDGEEDDDEDADEGDLEVDEEPVK